MKKAIFFAGLAAALAFTGCNKEADLAVSGKKVEIVLSNVDTRTVNDGMSTVWANDDALTVFYAPAGTTTWSANTKFTVTDAASNKATGEVELTADSYDWYLFYPYTSQIPNPTGKNDAGEWAGYFYVGSSSSGSQTQAGLNSSAHIAGSRVPVVGRATAVPADQTPAVPMKHLSTLLKINVTNVYENPVTINKVSFTAPVNIVGSAYIDFSGAEPVLVPSEGHIGKTAQLTVTNADPLASGATASFYLAVMPFSIASGDLLTVDIVAAEGSHKAEVEVSKAYTFAAGKVKNLNVDFEVETPTQTMTVTEALKAADESPVTIAGAIVAALSTRGYIITDGTNNVYVYLGSAPTVAIGDEVTLSATLDADYYGLPEIKSVSSCKVTSSGNTVPYTTLVELDKDNIDDYDCKNAADYIAVTGTLEKSSNYYSVRPEGSTRYARTDYMISSIDPSAYVGKKVTMKGYFNTLHSTGNYLKVVTTEFIPDDTPSAALASIAVSGQKTEFTVGDTFSFGGTVTATYADASTKDVTASATFTGYDMSTAGNQTVTVSYTEAEKTAETTYTITVTEKDNTLHTIVIEEFASVSFTSGAYSILAEKAEATNAPSYNASGKDLRVYAKGTLTVSNSKENMTKIVFNLSAQGKKRLAPITASTGTIATQTKGDSHVTWTGNANEVVFTVGDKADFGTDGSTSNGQLCFLSMDVAPWSDGDVQPKTLESIEVSGQKAVFTVGDEFSFGGTVTAVYSDGSRANVTEVATFSNPDMSTAGEKTVTVSYTDGGVTKTVTYTITVNAPIAGGLTFDFSNREANGLDQWPASKDDASEGTYVYVLDGKNYSFTTTKAGNGIYMNASYLMLSSGNYLGLPAIAGKKLVSVSATLNAGGNPSTAAKGTITSDTSGTVVTGGEEQTFDTKGGAKTFELTGTSANTVYYLAISNKNFQCTKIVLTYE